MWGKPTVRILEREQKPWTTEHKDREAYKSSDKDRDRTMTGIMIGPERAITDMVQINLMDTLHNVKTPMASVAAMASMSDCTRA